MFFSSLNQFYIFLAFLFLGLWAGLVKALIKVLSGNNLVYNILSVVFWPVLTLAFYIFAIISNFGLIRFYMIASLAVGFLISYKLFASLLAKSLRKVYNYFVKLKGEKSEREKSKANI